MTSSVTSWFNVLAKNKPFSACKHNYFTLLFMLGSQWNLVGLIVDGKGRTYQYDVISYVTRCWVIQDNYFLNEISNLTTAHCRGVASFLQRLWFCFRFSDASPGDSCSYESHFACCQVLHWKLKSGNHNYCYMTTIHSKYRVVKTPAPS